MHPGAQFREPITVEAVLGFETDCFAAETARLLPGLRRRRGLRGQPRRAPTTSRCGSAAPARRITHQHVSAAPSLTQFGAAPQWRRRCEAAGIKPADADYAAIYDSFTITLTILLEEIGLAPRGGAGKLARDGHFNHDGKLPLNTHGGLLSYGHCGVGGAMAHLVETHRQLTGRAGNRQAKKACLALLHGDGGVLSSHVSLVVEGTA